MENLDRILSSAKSDVRLQTIITNYLLRDGYPQNAIAGMSFKGQREDPPAFSLGLQIFRIPWGAIYVSKNLYSILSQEELEFVVLHEVAHIVKNHIVPSSIIFIGKGMVIDFLADLLEISEKKAREALGLIKTVWTLLKGQRTIEEEIKAQNEMEADKYAVTLQGRKEPAISALFKLTEGNVKLPTHVTIDGNFMLPVITCEQRIEAMKNL